MVRGAKSYLIVKTDCTTSYPWAWTYPDTNNSKYNEALADGSRRFPRKKRHTVAAASNGMIRSRSGAAFSNSPLTLNAEAVMLTVAETVASVTPRPPGGSRLWRLLIMVLVGGIVVYLFLMISTPRPEYTKSHAAVKEQITVVINTFKRHEMMQGWNRRFSPRSFNLYIPEWLLPFVFTCERRCNRLLLSLWCRKVHSYHMEWKESTATEYAREVCK
jgi:hypothetical protein